MPDDFDLAVNGSDSQWFRVTGNCGHCGVPGENCICTADDPCGCWRLHRPPSTARSATPVESLPMFGGSDV